MTKNPVTNLTKTAVFIKAYYYSGKLREMTKDKEKTRSAGPERTEIPTARRKKNSNHKSGRRRRGIILIVLGMLLILGSLSLTGYNLWDNSRAGKASDQGLLFGLPL